MRILAISTISGMQQRGGKKMWQDEEKRFKKKYLNKGVFVNRIYNADAIQVLVIDNVMIEVGDERYINWESEPK